MPYKPSSKAAGIQCTVHDMTAIQVTLSVCDNKNEKSVMNVERSNSNTVNIRLLIGQSQHCLPKIFAIFTMNVELGNELWGMNTERLLASFGFLKSNIVLSLCWHSVCIYITLVHHQNMLSKIFIFKCFGVN